MFNRRVRPLILQPTAIEALSPPGSSFQASHQDALIHLRASAALSEHKRLYRNPCTKGIGVDPWAGRTAWVTALRRSPSCSSPQDREMHWSGICTTRQDLPQPSLEAPNIGSCGSRFARLVGKFTHHGTKNRKGVRKEWHSCCGHVVSPRRSMSVPLPALGVQKKGRTMHLRARHGHRDHLRSLPVASRPTSVL